MHHLKSIFIVGYKRSGTTLLAKLLNMHPHVYIANEADVVWLLKQNSQRITNYKPYRNDSPAGMNFSLDKYGDSIESNLTINEKFINLLAEHNTKGTINGTVYNKNGVHIWGDQKPMQHSDHQLIEFILTHIINPYFIHIHRHPFYVVSSAKKFNKGTGGYIWKDMSTQQILEDWCYYNQQFLDAKKKYQLNSISIDYNALIKHPKKILGSIFSLLNENDLCDYTQIKKQVQHKSYKLNNYPIDDKTKNLMQIFGYKEFANWQITKAYYYIQKIANKIIG